MATSIWENVVEVGIVGDVEPVGYAVPYGIPRGCWDNAPSGKDVGIIIIEEGRWVFSEDLAALC